MSRIPFPLGPCLSGAARSIRAPGLRVAAQRVAPLRDQSESLGPGRCSPWHTWPPGARWWQIQVDLGSTRRATRMCRGSSSVLVSTPGPVRCPSRGRHRASPGVCRGLTLAVPGWLWLSRAEHRGSVSQLARGPVSRVRNALGPACVAGGGRAESVRRLPPPGCGFADRGVGRGSLCGEVQPRAFGPQVPKPTRCSTGAANRGFARSGAKPTIPSDAMIMA
jgi:hypothetical protein